MIGGNALAYADDFNSYARKTALPRPDPESRGIDALYRLYPARSGWVFVAAPRQKDWENLALAIGRANLISDERFVTPATPRPGLRRRRHRQTQSGRDYYRSGVKE